MATTYGQMPILTNPLLWGLVVVSTVVGGFLWGVGSAVGVFAGGLAGLVALAVLARLRDELAPPGHDGKIDPWDD